MDHIRFRIATLCNGSNTLGEIKGVIAGELNHSKQYINMIVDEAIDSFSQKYAVYWREEKPEELRDLGLTEDDFSHIRDDRQLSAPLFVIWAQKPSLVIITAGTPIPYAMNQLRSVAEWRWNASKHSASSTVRV